MLLNDFNDADDDIDDADGRPCLMKTTRTTTTMFVADGCCMLSVCMVCFNPLAMTVCVCVCFSPLCVSFSPLCVCFSP